jgi:hypothetical protein
VLEAALMEAQARRLNPQENRYELSKLVKLREHLDEAKAAHIIEAVELATLVMEISMILGDLGLPPIRGIPQDPGKARDVLEAMCVVMECLWKAHTSGAGP